eukprot:CAMPEP_0197823138 /NCGR_PEP_ID=MMETSP1437-20131217/462_1 /TAXON_ID=49252 ORGANISM="Eucampia antarctica, Strain CCMP1452" /NCGR_SAMPLE_ID=MMETSP1437 /ASSEMBLY_ACC=CAM_ASM_001096 /LENGTH=87 /DNA_ID=CAMNT_0043422137 /DNA_START=73 /DNA_END=336 /DNA_ORIENTATION=-
MSKSLLSLLIIALALAVSTSFSPLIRSPRLAETKLGLFGFGEKKKSEPQEDESNFLGGDDSKKWKGREAEDDAMWVDEPKKKDKKGK